MGICRLSLLSSNSWHSSGPKDLIMLYLLFHQSALGTSETVFAATRFPCAGIWSLNLLKTAFSKLSAEGLGNRISHHHQIRLICWHPVNQQHGSWWQWAPLPVWPTSSVFYHHTKGGASFMVMWGHPAIIKHLPGTRHCVMLGFGAAENVCPCLPFSDMGFSTVPC